MKHLLTAIRRYPNRFYLAALAVASAVTQLSFISRSSIWHDEGYTLLLSSQNWSDIIARTARDVHPPLHYLALNTWSSIFGTSELAARGLSVLFVVVSIVFAYLLVKRLMGEGPGRIAALFTAFGPFLIRYGQEARMYAMVAALLLVATYLLVLALDKRQLKWLYLYAIVMALAFYTHYYALFMVPVHWLYVLTRTVARRQDRPKGQIDLMNIHWWAANILIVALFVPWVPAAYAQFTRVQAGFWIPPVDLTTLPNTLAQFTAYTHFDQLATGGKLAVSSGLAALVAVAIAINRLQRRGLILLAAYALAGPVAVWLISLVSRPVYIERYFVFSAIGWYLLLAALLYVRPLNRLPKLRPLLIAVILALFGWGIRTVYTVSSHQMRAIGTVVSQQFEPGDRLVAGELYVYLDFSYYNATGQDLLLYSPGGISGFGETSLLYDQADRLVVEDYTALAPPSGRVWVIGKVGEKPYYQSVPESWQEIGYFQAGESVARLYRITD